jgi:isoleucyl-tRNA synthetase
MAYSDEFRQIPEDSTYAAHESSVLEYWKSIDVYKLLLEKEKRATKVFKHIDGPPFVTGTPHLGHINVGGLKNIFLNFHRMLGELCLNKPGWDTHGVPIESIVSKILGIETHNHMKKFTIAEYNQTCKDTIKKFSGSWQPTYDKIGRFADFSTEYKTMDLPFMESVWWIFKELWKKGLVYKGYKVTPYSYGCKTPLSNFEADQLYREESCESVYVRFKVIGEENIYFVAWTTTPWTLPSNIALCVGPEIKYNYYRAEDGNIYILGAGTENNIGIKCIELLKTVDGKELEGIEYIPIFNYMKRDTYKIVSDNYVKIGEDRGTCIVHLAPAFGDDDYRVCIDKKLVTAIDIIELCPVDDDGVFTDQVSDYKGILVFTASKQIVKDLRTNSALLRTQTITHSYPYCYRTEKPLIYKAVESFYIKTTSIKDDMLRINETINWYPEKIGTGRFRQWLEHVKDWCVSRSRRFGTPIPVWIADDGDSICVGSIDELVSLANLTHRPTDIHPEFVNDIVIVKDGKTYRRTEFIFDCWFESGSVPFGQIHYPFENKELIDGDDSPYLCDFIAEGLDQTRGWFYTLLVISTAICNKAPFKNVICMGMILDEFGVKFSKKNGNYTDPNILIDEYSADVLRLLLCGSQLVNAENLRFKNDEARFLKQKLIPLYGGVRFFIEHTLNYLKSGKKLDTSIYAKSTNTCDRWIIMRIRTISNQIRYDMLNYNVVRPIKMLIDFVEDLTNWYIKLNRDRLKGLEGEEERLMSLSTLYNVLIGYVTISAPFMPFLSEHIYQHIACLGDKLQTVHLLDFPQFDLIDTDNLQETFILLQRITRLIRNARQGSTTHTSVKTPIAKCVVYHNSAGYLKFLSHLIKEIEDEINCANFSFVTLEENLEYMPKLNMRNIGQKYRGTAKELVLRLNSLSSNELKEFYDSDDKSLIIDVNGEKVNITSDELLVILKPRISESSGSIVSIVDGDLMVSVDLTYDADIHYNCEASKFASFVQNMRKQNRLRPWNKINVYANASDEESIIFLTLKGEQICERLNCKLFMEDKDVKFESDIYSLTSFDKKCHEITVKIDVVK